MAVLLIASVAACSGGEGSTDDIPSDRQFGTMAVVAGADDGPDAGMEGTLTVDDDCVMVMSDDGSETLPIWPGQLVEWDNEERSVVVLDGGGDSVRTMLSDGAPVSLGGSGLDPSEPPLDGPFVGDLADLLGELQLAWVNEPSTECIDRADRAFVAREVVR